MSIPLIAKQAEILAYLGMAESATAADLALLEMLQRNVESEARRYCQHDIRQPATPYVEFLPATAGNGYYEGQFGGAEIVGSRAYLGNGSGGGSVLTLGQMYVRSITEIREDYNARAGQGAGDFGTATILVAGEDYYLDLATTGLSRTGVVIRSNGQWSSQPRTIKVTYVAGLTADELDSTYSDIKLAIIEEVIDNFKISKSRQNGALGLGMVSKQRLGSDFEVEYETGGKQNRIGQLSQKLRSRLQPYMRLGL